MPLPEQLTSGRILYLTNNPELIRVQLAGENLREVPATEKLRANVTTDQIIPAQFTTSSVSANQLGEHLLRGLDGIDSIVKQGDIQRGKFKYLVAKDIGGGSSREHAQHALTQAGIQGIFAQTWGEIFGRNNINYIIPTMRLETTEVQNLLHFGQPIPTEAYYRSLGPLSRTVAENGGILEFTKKRLAGEIELPCYQQSYRPMNTYEKIYAKILGQLSVRPNQQFFIPWDWAYFYELQSKDMGPALAFLESLGAKVAKPDRINTYEDHLGGRFDETSNAIREIQRRIAIRYNLREFRARPFYGVSAICHSSMAENFVEPGQFVIGNDSHTNALEFMGTVIQAVGNTEMAVAMFTGDTLVTIPEVIKINLIGQLGKGVHAKDLILHLGSTNPLRQHLIGISRKLYFEGSYLAQMSADEHFVLANMSRELQAEGGLISPNQQTLAYLQQMRPGVNFEPHQWEDLKPDPDAEYSQIIDINLADVEPTVALPGDPQSAVPLSKLNQQPEIADLIGPDGRIHITRVYTGSCMGGTLEALKNMAEVVTRTNNSVRQIHPAVEFYYQAASENVYKEALRRGYIQILEQAGAKFVNTACGACIGVGEGSMDIDNEVAIFDTNRNFAGREGKGKRTKVFLGNEEISAASAITGYLCSPSELD